MKCIFADNSRAEPTTFSTEKKYYLLLSFYLAIFMDNPALRLFKILTIATTLPTDEPFVY